MSTSPHQVLQATVPPGFRPHREIPRKARKLRNPDWFRISKETDDGPCRFEMLIANLGGIPPHTWEHSPQVRQFARAYGQRFYVPEWLLTKFGITVHADLY